VGNDFTLLDRSRHRLFNVNIFAALHGCQPDRSVPVVGPGATSRSDRGGFGLGSTGGSLVFSGTLSYSFGELAAWQSEWESGGPGRNAV
jgi:hypothetical protein